jgi:SAM-dependent methyltransferase
MEERRLEGDFYQYLHRFDQVDEEHNRNVLAFYVPYFDGCERVLDIGCGEGQFIELLNDAGIDAAGIDIDTRMVEICREKGFDVVEADLFEYLPGHTGHFDGIFSSNLIEHLTAQDATRFIRLSFEALSPGGVFLTATPNPESLIVHLHEFWRDATHIRPYNRLLLEFLLSWAGFEDITSGENDRTAWTPPPELQAVPDVLRNMAPQKVGMWDLGLPRIPEPAREPAHGSLLSGVRFSLRRRLARFLARTVLFEEFAAINEGFERAAGELRQLVAATQRIERALYHAQTKPLIVPREVFVRGIRPVDDSRER